MNMICFSQHIVGSCLLHFLYWPTILLFLTYSSRSNGFSPVAPTLSMPTSLTSRQAAFWKLAVDGYVDTSGLMQDRRQYRHEILNDLLLVRGGNDDPDGSTVDRPFHELDGGSSEEDPSTLELRNSIQKVQLSQQARNFAIAAVLWSSLFFDTILNKAKRRHLFVSVISASETTSAWLSSSARARMISTASLASGFALASCVSFLLWRDFDGQSERMSDGQHQSERGASDGLLSHSLYSDCANHVDTDEFACEIRQRLYLHLALFGILSLAAHLGVYFSEKAPFLGFGAAAINLHNTLVSMNALFKGNTILRWIMTSLMWPLRQFPVRGNDTTSRHDAMSFVCQLAAVAFWIRCIPTCKVIHSLGGYLLTARSAVVKDPTVLVTLADNARHLSLHIATLARLTLAAGVSQTICCYITKANELSNHAYHQLFLIVLSGMGSLLCLAVGGIMMLSNVGTGAWLSRTFPLEGILLLLAGFLSGYVSVSRLIQSVTIPSK